MPWSYEFLSRMQRQEAARFKKTIKIESFGFINVLLTKFLQYQTVLRHRKDGLVLIT